MLPSLRAQQYSTVSYGAGSGLSNLNVASILEARSGRIWIGTENGVFLANGTSFEKQASFQRAGIEQIRGLREDAAGRIWALDTDSVAYQEAGVAHGISALSPAEISQDAELLDLDGFPNAVYLLSHRKLLRVYTENEGRSWQVAPAIPHALLAAHPELAEITTVTAAGPMRFWAACGSSLCLVDLKRLTVSVKAPPPSLAAQKWSSLHVARNGALWARSESNLAVLPSSSEAIQTIAVPAGTRLDAKHPAILEDGRGRMMLNLSRGLARVRGNHWEMLGEQNGLPRQELGALAFTQAGDVWMGAVGHGITVWRGYDQWESWTEAQGMSSPVIWPMANDRNGGVWVATDATVDRIGLVSHHVTSMSGRMPAHRISALTVDQRGHVWAANSDGQLFDIDSRTKNVRVAADGLGKVSKLLEDSTGTLWVCARTGLYAVSSADGWKRPVLIGPDQLPSGYAWYISEGHGGTLWLSTAQGLFRRTRGGRWTAITLPSGSTVLKRYMVAESHDGTFWIQGLDPYPVLHMRVVGADAIVIDREATATLASDNLTFLDVDSRGWLWVGSDAGASVFNGIRWVRLTTEDGLVWDDTDFHAFYEDVDGSIWIGTSGGAAHLLHPERIFTSAVPTVRFNSASVAERPVSILGPTESNANVFDLPQAEFKATMLSTAYERGSAIEYRYRLDGVDETWQSTSSVIRYPALGPGSYTLSVVAYDVRRHQASAPAMISFRLLAPWWRRPWCLAAEGLLVVLLLTLGWRSRVRLLVRRQQQLEQIVQERTTELLREKKELTLARADLLAMSRRDGLTGLLNRGAIFEEMERLCEETKRTGRPLAYVMADLDGFKHVNDGFGHVAGDAVLRDCAARIRSELQSGELAGRYGGEELLILLPGLPPQEVIRRVEEVRKAIAREPVLHDEIAITITCSFGIAWFTNDDFSPERLIEKADEALYRAKRNGRNRFELARSLQESVGATRHPV